MNVLSISHSGVVDAYQGKLRRLAQYPGVAVTLVVPPRWKEGGRVIEAVATRCGAFETRVLPAYRLNRIASYFYQPGILQRTVSELSPSIVYCEEEPWSVAAWQAVHCARRVGAKTVFFTWENIRRRYKLPSEFILKSTLKTSAAAIAGNSDAAALLKERGFAKPILVLPQHGVNLDALQKKRGVIPGKDPPVGPVIAFIGRLEFEKGVQVLLHALSGIQREWSLVLVGNGSSRAEFVQLAESLRIGHRVTFLDAIPHEEVKTLLNQIDLLVLPSVTTTLWKEQFGRVLVEAMACGVPVVGSASGAIPEVVGNAGLLFRENDPDDLAAKITSFLGNPSLRVEYGMKARERVEQNYTDEVLAGKLYDFLSSVQHA